MSPLQRRLTKLEQHRQCNDVRCKLDWLLEKAGTSRAAVMAEYGSLHAFRDCLEAQGQASSASVRQCR
ncbi:MAG: hypothetical protein AW10_03979 [Candidatus Accumulibacter appositus]|uniref:Uncharacterized protein n=1 Tax=Candidatus Accumulibacter appositus TaxID=1454003 RepID=A0A011N3M2_9PROT|nr:MAG: hypothetical protein AW10_03979 [Candidatus Accumulibacter appositus]